MARSKSWISALAKIVERDHADQRLATKRTDRNLGIDPDRGICKSAPDSGQAPPWAQPTTCHPNKCAAKPWTPVRTFFLLVWCLLKMATSQRAFPGNTVAVVHHAILYQTPPPIKHPNAGLSAGLEPIITKALEKDRSLRYQSAADLRTDLKRLKRDLESRQGSVAVPEPVMS